MDVIVGFGPLHDRLFAASLRGFGLAAVAAMPPDEAALARGRALMARGHPSPVYYLGGAVTGFARAHRGGPLRFVVPGDRCGSYATDLARALTADGARGHEVLAVAPERSPATLKALGVDEPARVDGLVDALAAGDALTAASSALQTRARNAPGAEAPVRTALRDVEAALEQGGSTLDALRRNRLPRIDGGRAPTARVRVVGEFLPTRYDDAVGAGLARWMTAQGVTVDVPTLCEWVLYAAWRAGHSDGLRAHLVGALERACEALGVATPRVVDSSAWTEVAARWLPLSLCAGSGFMELAAYLASDAAGDVDLVLSLKPFASITSSAASDAVIHHLATSGRTAFLALELHGDLQAQLESRVTLALQTATITPREIPSCTDASAHRAPPSSPSAR